MLRRVGRHALVLLTLAAPCFAGFSGTDVFLPSVGARPGVPPAVWYTTVWVHNPNPTAANLTFYLLERQENLSPRSYTDTIPAGDTKRYDNAVKTFFGVEVFGAIRVTAVWAAHLGGGRMLPPPPGRHLPEVFAAPDREPFESRTFILRGGEVALADCREVAPAAPRAGLRHPAAALPRRP